jgi:hypothetical protein
MFAFELTINERLSEKVLCELSRFHFPSSKFRVKKSLTAKLVTLQAETRTKLTIHITEPNREFLS